MHYAKIHFGDYARDTAHLSMIEHGAYLGMMRLYYTTEKPLTHDRQQLYRLLMARTKDEQAAVDAVLADFFTETEEGWQQKRIEQEISKCAERTKINQEVGRLGGRPVGSTNKPKGNPQETQTVSKANPQETLPTTHYPLPTTQESKPLSGKPDLLPQSREILEFLNAKTGRAYKPVAANLEMIRNRLKEGYTVAELRQVVAKKCREWGTDEKMAIYLRPATLFNKTNLAQYSGELVIPREANA